MKTLSNEEILELIILAKLFYLESERYPIRGMCRSFYLAMVVKGYILEYHDIEYKDIRRIIPEFNLEFLEAKKYDIDWYWWHINDTESRIRAFDKLINLYKQKINENSL